MSEDLVLYSNPQSRGRIARWMLEELGEPYHVEWLEYGTSMKSPEYLAINPMGKVPAIRHGQTIVTETPAVCAYLADAFPKAKLAPPLDRRGDYYRWLFFTAGPVEMAVIHRALQFEPPADRQAMVGYGTFDLALDALAGALATREFIAADHFTAADVYVGAQLGWGLQFNTIPARTEFSDYVERMQGRAAWVRANQLDDAAAEVK